jgi:hypothetical protein
MAVAAAVLAVGLTGCAGEPEVEWPDDPPQRDNAVQASPPTDPAEAEATEEILALVQDYREVEVASYADPQPPHIARLDLSDYLADPLLSRTLVALDELQRSGIVYEGRPAWDPTVAELRLDETPPTATIRDCVDATEWRSVFQATGNPVQGEGRPDHYVMRMEAKLFDEGWLLHNGGMEADAEC